MHAVRFVLTLDVQQAQADIQVAVGVVAHIHLPDEGLAGVEIQLFHLILLCLVHVDGVLVQQHRHGEAIHLADHAVLERVGDVDDHEILFRRRAAQADLAGREVLRRPVVAPVHVADNARVLDVAEQLLGAGGIAEAVAVLKGQFESRALEVAEEDVQVVRIEQRVFRRLAQEIIRVADDVLIDGSGGRNVEDDARPLSAACTTCLLPGAGDGARVAAEHAGIQRADVNAQFEGVGGDHRVDVARAQALLDLAALRGQIAAAVAPHPARIAQRIANEILEVLRQHLHSQAGAGKGDGLDAVLQQHGGDVARLRQNTPADPQLAVHHRRIVEHEVPCTHGGAVIIDHVDGAARERLRQLLGIGDGGRAEDELRLGAIEIAQAQQAAQDIGQVGAEHAAVGMDLVDDDILQVLEQLDPLGVVGQDAGMQHVRVGDDDVTRLPHGLTGSAGGITVVGVGFDIYAHFLDQLVQLADLVGGEGFGREQVQGPGVLVFEDGGEDGQVIAHGFARGRGGDHDDIPPGEDFADGMGLVGIELVHAAARQHRLEACIEGLGERGIMGLPGRHGFPAYDIFHEQRVTLQLLGQLIDIHTKPPGEHVTHIYQFYLIIH